MESGTSTSENAPVIAWTVRQLELTRERMMKELMSEGTGVTSIFVLRRMFPEEEAKRIQQEQRRTRCRLLMQELRAARR